MTIDDEIRKAILHDIHKVFKRKHNNNKRDLDTLADRDAARMSRHPRARDDQNGENLSKSFFERDMTDHIWSSNDKEMNLRNETDFCQREYIDSTDSTPELHIKLLNDKIISKFNEISTMPFTSLKYHTLLVCALHWNYKQGRDFKDLYLHCIKEKPKDEYTVIFQFDNIWFAINNDVTGAKIGAPAQYFGQTIGRLYHIPLPDYLIDNMRRFRSWSVGLQYLEDALIFIKSKEVV